MPKFQVRRSGGRVDRHGVIYQCAADLLGACSNGFDL